MPQMSFFFDSLTEGNNVVTRYRKQKKPLPCKDTYNHNHRGRSMQEI